MQADILRNTVTMAKKYFFLLSCEENVICADKNTLWW